MSGLYNASTAVLCDRQTEDSLMKQNETHVSKSPLECNPAATPPESCPTGKGRPMAYCICNNSLCNCGTDILQQTPSTAARLESSDIAQLSDMVQTAVSSVNTAGSERFTSLKGPINIAEDSVYTVDVDVVSEAIAAINKLNAILPLHMLIDGWGLVIPTTQTTWSLPVGVYCFLCGLVSVNPSELPSLLDDGSSSFRSRFKPGIATVPVSNAQQNDGASVSACEYRDPVQAFELAAADACDEPTFVVPQLAKTTPYNGQRKVPTVNGADGRDNQFTGLPEFARAWPLCVDDQLYVDVLCEPFHTPAIPVQYGLSTIPIDEYFATYSQEAKPKSSPLYMQQFLAPNPPDAVNRTACLVGAVFTCTGIAGLYESAFSPTKPHEQLAKETLQDLVNSVATTGGSEFLPDPGTILSRELGALTDRVLWYAFNTNTNAAELDSAWEWHGNYDAFGLQCKLPSVQRFASTATMSTIHTQAAADARPIPDSEANVLATEPLYKATRQFSRGTTHFKALQSKFDDKNPMSAANYAIGTSATLVIDPSDVMLYPGCMVTLTKQYPPPPQVAGLHNRCRAICGATNPSRLFSEFRISSVNKLNTGTTDGSWNQWKSAVQLDADWSGRGVAVLDPSLPGLTCVPNGQELPAISNPNALREYLITRIVTEASVLGGLMWGQHDYYTHIVTDCKDGKVYAMTAEEYAKTAKLLFWGSREPSDGSYVFAVLPCQIERWVTSQDTCKASPCNPQTPVFSNDHMQSGPAGFSPLLNNTPLKPIPDLAEMAPAVPDSWSVSLQLQTYTLKSPPTLSIPTGTQYAQATGKPVPVVLQNANETGISFTIDGKAHSLVLVLQNQCYPQHVIKDESGSIVYKRFCTGGFLPRHAAMIGTWFVSTANENEYMYIHTQVDGTSSTADAKSVTMTSTAPIFDLPQYCTLTSSPASKSPVLCLRLSSHPLHQLQVDNTQTVQECFIGVHPRSPFAQQFDTNAVAVFGSSSIRFGHSNTMEDANNNPMGSLTALAVGKTPSLSKQWKPPTHRGEPPDSGTESSKQLILVATAVAAGAVAAILFHG